MDERPKELSLKTAFSVNIFALVVQGVLRLGFTTVVARGLGAAGFADFAFVLAVSTFVSILWPSSAGAGFTKYVGRELVSGSLDAAGGLACHLVKRQVAFLALSSPIVFAVTWAVTNSVISAAAAVLLSWLVGYQTFGRGVHLAFRKVVREFVWQVSAGVVALLGVSLVAVAGGPPLSPILATLMLACGLAVYMAASLPRLACGRRAGIPIRHVDRFVMLAAVGSLASAGAVQLLVLIGRVRLDVSEAGQLAAAVSFALPLTLFSGAISMTTVPRFSALLLGGNRLQASSFRFGIVLSLHVVFVPLSVLLIIFTPSVVPLILGRGYEGSAALLSILMVGLAIGTLYAPSVAFLNAGSNRMTALVTGATWLGLAVTLGAWLWPSVSSGTEFAVGFGVGLYVAGTVIVAVADQVGSRRAILFWLCGGTTLILSACVSSRIASAGFELTSALLVATVVLTWSAPLLVSRFRFSLMWEMLRVSA